MSERQVENAVIEATTLGTEDHGIFSYYLHLKFNGSGQGFGGYALDGPLNIAGNFKGRRGCAYGAETLRRILEVLEVPTWEKLTGTPCRADHDYGRVYRIGHYMKDKWFDPSALRDELVRDGVETP